jgi:hypothetical protein
LGSLPGDFDGVRVVDGSVTSVGAGTSVGAKEAASGSKSGLSYLTKMYVNLCEFVQVMFPLFKSSGSLRDFLKFESNGYSVSVTILV